MVKKDISLNVRGLSGELPLIDGHETKLNRSEQNFS